MTKKKGKQQEEARSIVSIQFEAQGSADIVNWAIYNMTVWQLVIAREFIARQIDIMVDKQLEAAKAQARLIEKKLITVAPPGVNIQ